MPYHQTRSHRKGVCAALLVAVALLIIITAAAAPADKSRPPIPDEVVGVLVVAGIFVLAFLIWCIACLDEVLTLRRTKGHWDRLLARAQAMANESNNFSDAWFAKVASQYGDAIRPKAERIDREAAERKIEVLRHEAEYQRIGDYAAERYGLDKSEVIQMLRNAIELPARLLEECKKPRKELPAPNTRGCLWINPSGEALSFLPKVPPKRRKHRDSEREKDQKVWKEQERKVHALDHGIEVAKRRSVKASWDRKTRDYAGDLAPPPPTHLEKAWHQKLEKNELELQDDEAASRLGQEKVVRAKNEAIRVYRDPNITTGEKRLRIDNIMDTYGVDQNILPPAIQELLEEED